MRHRIAYSRLNAIKRAVRTRSAIPFVGARELVSGERVTINLSIGYY